MAPARLRRQSNGDNEAEANVASDPLMSLEYGVKGGMVVLAPTTRDHFPDRTDTVHLHVSKVPVLTPTSVSEAYTMIGEAFELRENTAPRFLPRNYAGESQL